MEIFLKCFTLIALAELGDKTQILAMAFATKYKWHKVLMGIFIGIFLNHLIAVLIGNFVGKALPITYIQIAAGLLFIFFGIWTLKGDDDEEAETNTRTKLGPVLTVASAFFVGELGDKTQLAALTLAAQFKSIFTVLLGTVSAMMVVGASGVLFGAVIGKKIPKKAIKWISALIFIGFGIVALVSTLRKMVG